MVPRYLRLVTKHRFLNLIQIVVVIQPCCDLPIFPANVTARDTIYLHADATERFLRGVNPSLRIDHVIKLQHTVRGLGIPVYKVTVGGADQGAACELRKRDVIGMSVGPIGAERDNNLWLNAPNVRDNLSNDFFRVRLIYIAINVIKETHFLETEIFRGAAQLRF